MYYDCVSLSLIHVITKSKRLKKCLGKLSTINDESVLFMKYVSGTSDRCRVLRLSCLAGATCYIVIIFTKRNNVNLMKYYMTVICYKFVTYSLYIRSTVSFIVAR